LTWSIQQSDDVDEPQCDRHKPRMTLDSASAEGAVPFWTPFRGGRGAVPTPFDLLSRSVR
jgi:hypothetical protein